MAKKDNKFVKKWMYKLDPKPHPEGHITPAGWKILKTLPDVTYNQIITHFETKLEPFKAKINKQIDEEIEALKKRKV